MLPPPHPNSLQLPLVSTHRAKLTINVPVVDMAREVMIFMRANTFRWPLEGVGPENRDFLGP
jgi:hypothetical protein